MSKPLKAPFPYFGGKSRVAEEVWKRFGSVKNYVEPFCGSAAMLLLRPDFKGQTETINDKDGLLSNFWRALKHDPNGVAEHANWPVNEADLHARHLWLKGRREALTEHLMGDPDFYDTKAAGWWVWGVAIWIGTGWTSEFDHGPWVSDNGVFTKVPKKNNAGTGVNRKLPHLGNAGKGVNRQLPHLGNAGTGVNRQLPHLGNAGTGVDAGIEKVSHILNPVAERIREVRVACGDWNRVLGPSVTTKHGLTAVFLDPPYLQGEVDYAEGHRGLGDEVREWCIENGTNPDLRIALCGYEGDHNELEELGWSVFEWKAHGGYGSQGDNDGRENSKKERIWFSPHCLNPNDTVNILDMFNNPEDGSE